MQMHCCMRWFHNHVLRLLGKHTTTKCSHWCIYKKARRRCPWKYDSMRILPYAAFRFCTILLRLRIHKNNDYLNFVHTLFYAHRSIGLAMALVNTLLSSAIVTTISSWSSCLYQIYTTNQSIYKITNES